MLLIQNIQNTSSAVELMMFRLTMHYRTELDLILADTNLLSFLISIVITAL